MAVLPAFQIGRKVIGLQCHLETDLANTCKCLCLMVRVLDYLMEGV